MNSIYYTYCFLGFMLSEQPFACLFSFTHSDLLALESWEVHMIYPIKSLSFIQESDYIYQLLKHKVSISPTERNAIFSIICFLYYYIYFFYFML